MKKKYFFLLLMMAVLQGMAVQAQTDVTATHIKNAGFDETPIHYTVAGGTVLTAGVERIGTTGWIFPVPQWNNESVINANAVQIATGEYGTVANPQGFNVVAVPATDRNGNSAGAAVSMSAGWGDQAMLAQDVILSSGRYVLKMDVRNAHTVTTIAVNRFGFIALDGTTYFSKRMSYPSGQWLVDSVSFFLAEETVGKINLGYTTSSGGSANGAKFFLDNVQLIYYGIDKTVLKQWIDSATVLVNNKQDVGESTAYADLEAIITAAQGIYDKTNASALEVISYEEALKEAIDAVHGAILLQSRINTWTNLPVNATGAILNNSFEDLFDGTWVAVGAFQRQNNASFDPFKVGTFYAERWVTGGTSLENLRMSQVVKNLPNGVYRVTASAHAVQQTGTVYPGGAYLIGNGNVTEIFDRKDYSVIAEVVDNTLELGIEVALTGNWIAFDNFRLSYISDGSPYLVTDAEKLSLTPSQNVKTVIVSGGNLTENVTITATPSFQLSKSSFTANEVMGGAELTVTSVATSAVANDSIVISHGDVKKVIYLNVAEKINVTAGGLFFDQTLPSSSSFDLTGDVFGTINITAPDGIFLSMPTVTPSEALLGAPILLVWDETTRIENKYIYISTGGLKDSVLVFAVSDNIISSWDGDKAEGEGSQITNFGWSLMMQDGVTPVAGAFNPYAATSGIRYVDVTNQNYTYKGKPWKGGRLAYLRTWGDPATNVFNLSVNLDAEKSYAFRGVASWHDNEANPTFTYAINTAMSNTGDTLAIQANAFTVKRAAQDYSFTFRPTTTGTHYLTISSNVIGDVMNSPLYLAIYEKVLTSASSVDKGSVQVYPTITSDKVMIETAGKTGVVRAYDLTGKLAASMTLKGGVEELSLPGEGVYFLQLMVDNTIQTVKVIRVK